MTCLSGNVESIEGVSNEVVGSHGQGIGKERSDMGGRGGCGQRSHRGSDRSGGVSGVNDGCRGLVLLR